METRFGHQLYNWHLELSGKCALKCSRCFRTEHPDKFKAGELSLSFIKRVFQPEFLRANVWRMTFSGGVGDAIYHSQLIEVIEYLKSAHSRFQLVLVTNGSHRPRRWWSQLRAVLGEWDEIIFSIDGYDQESNRRYRANSDWDSIMDGIKEMVASPALVRWSTIPFSFNQDHLSRIQSLAEGLGVDSFYVAKSDRFGGAYIDPDLGIDPLAPRKEWMSPDERIHRTRVKFSPSSAKWRAMAQYYRLYDQVEKASYDRVREQFADSFVLPTCRFGYRGVYVDVEGFYYPCSWISHPFDEVHSKTVPGRKMLLAEGISKYKDRLDLNKRELVDVLNDPLWAEMERDWHSPLTTNIVCEHKCAQHKSKLTDIRPKDISR